MKAPAPGGPKDTRRVALTLDGERFDWWTRVEIIRDMNEIAGSFELECLDLERNRQAFPDQRHAARWPTMIRPGMQAKLSIDGELVLVGWLDDVSPAYSGDKIGVVIQGRDATGDLVDCAANPTGPAEYRNLSLTEICTRLCLPFGITVRADVDVGARFPVFALDVAETVMSAIEKACRQRAVLAVSDGVGGLLLTRGGTRRGPDPLRWGGNVLEAQARFSWRDRYSQVKVKGQSQAPAIALDGTAGPLTAASTPVATPAARPAPASATARGKRAGVALVGTATDAEISRYRPHVVQAKTQSGGASVQTQAEWHLRVAKGKGSSVSYAVADWRAGPADPETGLKRLWRPNELVLVDDAWLDLLDDMLVAGVVYGWGPEGATTKLRVLGRHALDLEPQGAPTRHRRAAATRTLDGRANALGSGT